MSHFAEIDENNFVIRVLVGDNNDPNGDEGYQWFIDNLGGRWVQTSYSGSFRKNYAATGYFYNETLDAFIPPTPFPSWVLNEITCKWEAPIPYPSNGQIYYWNELSLIWEISNSSELEA